MRRKRIILVILFLAGVLVSGIGAGIAFIEYSSFEFGEKQILGEEHLVTEELDFPIEDEGILILSGRYFGAARSGGVVGRNGVLQTASIEEDADVPVDVVRYRITYNDSWLEPYLNYEAYQAEKTDEPESAGADRAASDAENGDETESGSGAEQAQDKIVYAGVLRLSFSYTGDEFRVLMENKDWILSNLKQKKIPDYELASVEDVRILVNPDTLERIENRLWR